ncbi:MULTISPECIES: fimbria/pilus periplasmic chaperone [Alcanivorax]|uniref:fimbrial biogenesis chaperone n=1 Tax=Alcanivorax TaxID=59753 RepID=UPI0025BA1813|nr:MULTISPECIES: fimbria/pilus periplasmic chaperone [Alcanivorax]
MPVARARPSLASRPRLIVFLVSFLLACSTQAGSFRITPLRVQFDHNNPTTQLSIENNSERTVTLQTTVMRWQQDGGQDNLTPSNDIFVSPPILMLKPGGRQVIRLRHMPAMPSEEKAYRLYLQDTAARARQSGGANMAVRIGLPIFVSPGGSQQPDPRINTRYQDGIWQVSVSNAGSTNFRVIGLDAFRGSADRDDLKKDDLLEQSTQPVQGFPYVFADQTREWHVKAPANAQLRLRTDIYGYRRQGFDERGTVWLGEPENKKDP